MNFDRFYFCIIFVQAAEEPACLTVEFFVL